MRIIVVEIVIPAKSNGLKTFITKNVAGGLRKERTKEQSEDYVWSRLVLTYSCTCEN
jgi:hypothetical protein